MRNIHIVTIGFDPHPSLDMLACGDVDKIYLLNDRNEEEARKSERFITDLLDRINLIEYEVKEIDCYDYYDVYDTILEIIDSERTKAESKFHINFSRGTAIVVGAACNAACTVDDVDLYYSKWKSSENSNVDGRIIHVDVSEFSALTKLKEATKKLFLYFENAKDDTLSNTELKNLSGLEINSLTYHTKKLIKLGLVMKSIDGRNTNWCLTRTGKRVLKKIMKEKDWN